MDGQLGEGVVFLSEQLMFFSAVWVGIRCWSCFWFAVLLFLELLGGLYITLKWLGPARGGFFLGI